MPVAGRAAAAAALLLFAGIAAAPAAAQPERLEDLTALDMFELAERATAQSRIADAESLYSALAHDPDPEVRAEARFRHGMLLSRIGRLGDAALLFRAILDEKPDAARVRIELARILALMGDESAAGRELRQAQASNLPADVALLVDQYANALRARRPLGGSLSLAIVPDSNINRATDRETLDTVIAPLDLSEDARERSGIGLRIGAQGYLRLPLAENLTLLPRLSGQAELYGQSQFNDVAATAALGLELRHGRNRINPTLAQSFRFYGGDHYASTQTASLGWQRRLGTRAHTRLTGSASRADYHRNDLQDGWLADLEASYEQAFDPRSGGSVTVSGGRHVARDPGYSTASGGLSLLYWREFGRTGLFVSASGRRLEADQRLLLFPERRRDWFYGGTIGATLRQVVVNGFAPSVRLGYERNRSTVELYDFSRVSASFGITRAF